MDFKDNLQGINRAWLWISTTLGVSRHQSNVFIITLDKNSTPTQTKPSTREEQRSFQTLEVSRGDYRIENLQKDRVESACSHCSRSGSRRDFLKIHEMPIQCPVRLDVFWGGLDNCESLWSSISDKYEKLWGGEGDSREKGERKKTSGEKTFMQEVIQLGTVVLCTAVNNVHIMYTMMWQ